MNTEENRKETESKRQKKDYNAHEPEGREQKTGGKAKDRRNRQMNTGKRLKTEDRIKKTERQNTMHNEK